MKKFRLLIVALVVLSLCGCSKKEEPQKTITIEETDVITKPASTPEPVQGDDGRVVLKTEEELKAEEEITGDYDKTKTGVVGQDSSVDRLNKSIITPTENEPNEEDTEEFTEFPTVEYEGTISFVEFLDTYVAPLLGERDYITVNYWANNSAFDYVQIDVSLFNEKGFAGDKLTYYISKDINQPQESKLSGYHDTYTVDYDVYASPDIHNDLGTIECVRANVMSSRRFTNIREDNDYTRKGNYPDDIVLDEATELLMELRSYVDVTYTEELHEKYHVLLD